jgi:AcrR family transcriptional regulator
MSGAESGPAPGEGLRKRQAAATRRQIVAAAARAFERRGYEGARIADIAAEAGVAVPTVYKAFANKCNLLTAAAEAAMAGDADCPVDRQAWWLEQLAAPDAGRQLELIARNARRIYERAGLLLEVVRGAARTDGGVAALWQRLTDERYERSTPSAERLAEKTRLRTSVGEAARTLWALTAPELYVLQVERGGFGADRYERWLADLLKRALLPA